MRSTACLSSSAVAGVMSEVVSRPGGMTSICGIEIWIMWTLGLRLIVDLMREIVEGVEK